MQKKAAVGTVLVLIALVMMGISLVMPWYMNEYKLSSGGFSFTTGLNFYLDRLEVNFDLPAGFNNSVNATSEGGSYDDEEAKDLNFVKSFKMTQTFVIIGIVGCVIGLMGSVLAALNKMKPKIGVLLVLIAVILTILAPIYLMATLPKAFEDDGMVISAGDESEFFGTKKDESDGLKSEYRWGGAIGWFLPIIAAVICIIALILVAKSKPAPQAFSIEGPIVPAMAPAEEIPSFTIEPETPAAIPMAQPVMDIKPKGEEFQCPQCSKVFIVALEKRPLHIKCPYCGLEGIVE